MTDNFNAKKCQFAAFDLDETLLHRGAISDFTIKTLEKLSKSGVEVIIATGRGLQFIPESITKLPFIRYIISACGASVTDMKTGKTVWDAPIDKDLVLRVLSTAGRYRAGHCVYYDGLVVSTERSIRYMSINEPPEFVEAFEKEFHIPMTRSARRHIHKHPKPVIKLDLYFRKYPELAACFGALMDIEGIQLTDSPGVCIEITKKGVGKAGGLAALLERLGASSENVIAFGDSGNDIDMLEYAGFSVAMGTAGQAVRAHADHIALPAKEDGAAKAILELFALDN